MLRTEPGARVFRTFSASALAVLLSMSFAARTCSAAAKDGLVKTSYSIVSGDVNGDGKPDFLIKAPAPKLIMLPIDDDLDVPIVIPPPAPTFVLLSTPSGSYSLVSNPDANTTGFSGWSTSNYQAVAGDGANAATLSLVLGLAEGSGPTFVVALTDTGDLQIASQSTGGVTGGGTPFMCTPFRLR